MSCFYTYGYTTSEKDAPLEMQKTISAKKQKKVEKKQNERVFRYFTLITYVKLFNFGPFLESQPDKQTTVNSAECWK